MVSRRREEAGAAVTESNGDETEVWPDHVGLENVRRVLTCALSEQGVARHLRVEEGRGMMPPLKRSLWLLYWEQAWEANVRGGSREAVGNCRVPGWRCFHGG